MIQKKVIEQNGVFDGDVIYKKGCLLTVVNDAAYVLYGTSSVFLDAPAYVWQNLTANELDVARAYWKWTGEQHLIDFTVKSRSDAVKSFSEEFGI
jgi:hypothetical protein